MCSILSKVEYIYSVLFRSVLRNAGNIDDDIFPEQTDGAVMYFTAVRICAFAFEEGFLLEHNYPVYI